MLILCNLGNPYGSGSYPVRSICSNISLFMHTLAYCIHLSTKGHLDFFYVLAFINRICTLLDALTLFCLVSAPFLKPSFLSILFCWRILLESRSGVLALDLLLVALLTDCRCCTLYSLLNTCIPYQILYHWEMFSVVHDIEPRCNDIRS